MKSIRLKGKKNQSFMGIIREFKFIIIFYVCFWNDITKLKKKTIYEYAKK